MNNSNTPPDSRQPTYHTILIPIDFGRIIVSYAPNKNNAIDVRIQMAFNGARIEGSSTWVFYPTKKDHYRMVSSFFSTYPKAGDNSRISTMVRAAIRAYWPTFSAFKHDHRRIELQFIVNKLEAGYRDQSELAIHHENELRKAEHKKAELSERIIVLRDELNALTGGAE